MAQCASAGLCWRLGCSRLRAASVERMFWRVELIRLNEVRGLTMLMSENRRLIGTTKGKE